MVLPKGMEKKMLMIYNLKGKDSERIKINRKLFQYKIQSHKGKYKRTTKGILTNYEKPTRSVVIFNKAKLPQVKKLLETNKIQHRLYKIIQIVK